MLSTVRLPKARETAHSCGGAVLSRTRGYPLAQQGLRLQIVCRIKSKRFRIRPCTIFGDIRSGAVGVRTISFRARGKAFPLRSSAFIFGLSAGTGPDGALADPPATPAPFEPAASAKPLPLPLPDTDAVAACSNRPWHSLC